MNYQKVAFVTFSFLFILILSFSIKSSVSEEKTTKQVSIQRKDIYELQDEGYTGKGVKIAVLDTGISKELLDSFSDEEYAYYNSSNNSNDIVDYHSHGTLVVCIMVCLNTGLARNAEFVFIKVYDDEGRILPEYVSSGIDYAISENVDIINLSFGTLTNYESIHIPLKKAKDKGIIIIAAYGDEEQMYPAKYSEVTSVGIKNTQAEAQFILEKSIYDHQVFDNTIFYNDREATSSLSCALFTSIVALLIEKCIEENIKFDLENYEGMIK